MPILSDNMTMGSDMMRKFKKIEMGKIVCPHCGCEESYIYFATDDNKEEVISEWGECTSCGKRTYDHLFVYKDGQVNIIPCSVKPKDKYIPPKPTVKCPYCGSTSTKKISTLSRMGSFATFGFAGKKVGKQWHCNNCKSDF